MKFGRESENYPTKHAPANGEIEVSALGRSRLPSGLLLHLDIFAQMKPLSTVLSNPEKRECPDTGSLPCGSEHPARSLAVDERMKAAGSNHSEGRLGFRADFSADLRGHGARRYVFSR